ncbi:unnamed protein product [Musa acuminata subsp. burmannicoides]
MRSESHQTESDRGRERAGFSLEWRGAGSIGGRSRVRV